MIETCILDIRHLFVTDDKAIKFGSNLIKMNKQILGIFPTVTSIIVKKSAPLYAFCEGQELGAVLTGKTWAFPHMDSQLSHTEAEVGRLETTV